MQNCRTAKKKRFENAGASKGERNEMLNKVVIMGRLTRDPEYRTTATGTSVVNFSVAVDRDFSGQSGEKETDFINCVAWRKTAEFVTKHFMKGSMIVVAGRLQVSSWTDDTGNKRQKCEVVADNVYFGESKRSRDADIGADSSAYAPQPAVPATNFVTLEGPDEQLPF